MALKQKEQYWEERIRKSSPIGSGDTNDLYLTEEDTLIKVFPDFSFPLLVHAVGHLLALKLNYLFSKDRVNREINLRKEMEKLDIGFPKIIRRDGCYLEVEYLEGKTVREVLEVEPDRAERLGKRIGKIVDKMHEENVAPGDLALENFMVERGTIYLLDFEYGETDADYFEKFMGQLTLLMELRTMDSSVCTEFLAGFESETEVYLNSRIVSIVYALGFSIIVRRNWEMLSNTLQNSFS